jgi:hypothetical protein
MSNPRNLIWRTEEHKYNPGTAGVKTGICWIQLLSATAVPTGGFNCSVTFWFHVQELLSVMTQRDARGVYNTLNQNTAEHLKYSLPKFRHWTVKRFKAPL